MHSLHDCSETLTADVQESGNNGHGQLDNADIALVLRNWLLEQRSFQKNVMLRRQHAKLAKQILKWKQHLPQKQHQKATLQHKGVKSRVVGSQKGKQKVSKGSSK